MADIFEGTLLKVNVNVPPIDGVKMESYDFLVEAYCSPYRKVVISKAEAKQVNDSNFMVQIDTSKTGCGALTLRILCNLPDPDCKDDVRPEVFRRENFVNVV